VPRRSIQSSLSLAWHQAHINFPSRTCLALRKAEELESLANSGFGRRAEILFTQTLMILTILTQAHLCLRKVKTEIL